MQSIRRMTLAVALLMLCATGSEGQERDSARRAYFRAVASYFDLQPSEVAILADWDLPADEIPVVLFVASRAGVSSEALVALRSSGRSWTELIRRYQIGPATLHVPLGAQAAAGPLTAAYERYRATPVRDWASIPLDDREIVALVNVRLLSEALGMAPEQILSRAGSTTSFVDLYARLIR